MNESYLREFDTLEEASIAAAKAAAVNYGIPVQGILYSQAGRRFISTSLPIKMLLQISRRDSTDRKKDDPSTHRNRPLDSAHVREIATYLSNENTYIMPPIMLNAVQPLMVFKVRGVAATHACVFVLPHSEYLFVTDGQHRLEALRQAIIQKPELEKDAVGVTIVEESDIDKSHQDFFDAAQVMPLARALLVEYDSREPLNWLTKELSNRATILRNRVERVGTVGKNSIKLFTTNQIKQAVLQVVVGDWSLWGDQMLKQAEESVGPAKDLWSQRILGFFEEFTQANEIWNKVAERPLESGLTTDIPAMRQNYLHFTGGGLLVICGVGHSILELNSNPDGSFTDQRKGLIQSLAQLDWSRRGELWQGYLVSPQGTTNPQKNNIVLAVAKIKAKLGLALTIKEQGKLVPAEEVMSDQIVSEPTQVASR